MPRAFKAVVKRFAAILLLSMSTTSVRPSSRAMAEVMVSNDGTAPVPQATLKPASAAAATTSPDIPFRDYDPAAERMMLDLANQSRAQAGLAPLAFDPGLCQAARVHAEAMLAARQLSHQFEGEPSLAQRLGAVTKTTLDQEGENVALDFNPENGHKHLMLSPPHRANLLNPSYNVIGVGIVRSGEHLYIVEDFGHALPNFSTAEVKDKIAASVLQQRHQATQSDFARRDLPNADAAACSMAQADKLGTAATHQLAQRYTVLTYTSQHPEELPGAAGQALAGHNLRTFSVGMCYARTETYPTGVYWVLLSLD